jgi:hypothetical protein
MLKVIGGGIKDSRAAIDRRVDEPMLIEWVAAGMNEAGPLAKAVEVSGRVLGHRPVMAAAPSGRQAKVALRLT